MTGVTPILSAIPPVNTVHFKPKASDGGADADALKDPKKNLHADDGRPSDRGGNADVLKAVENKEPQAMAWAVAAGRWHAGGFGLSALR